MSMQIFSARSSTFFSVLMLAGCGGSKSGKSDFAVDLIECAHRGAALAQACAVDRRSGHDGLILTLRHPDGGFHRLLVTKDGRGVIAADGAEQAIVRVIGDGAIEVALGGERYRLPATIKGMKL